MATIEQNVSIKRVSVEQLASQLVAWFNSDSSYVVALSGGVDSAVVAKGASLSGCNVLLATAASQSVAARELSDAHEVASSVELQHEIVQTRELDNPAYAMNDGRRCYHCKSELFSTLQAKFADRTIVTGTNHDDLGDYRPGLVAASERAVRAPLAELGYGKQDVRALAEHWGLSIADKPASPCLASRIAYGTSVTPERLARIEAAETFLRSRGFVEFRVRLHEGELARIEVAASELTRLASEPLRSEVIEQLTALGFRFITLDLAGFKSGSLNSLVQIGVRGK